MALMKLASTAASIMYKSIKNRHPWQTSYVRVKGSDRRPFILILDWILVYTSLTIRINLSPYSNLKDKDKDITERFLFSLFDTPIMYTTNSRRM